MIITKFNLKTIRRQQLNYRTDLTPPETSFWNIIRQRNGV